MTPLVRTALLSAAVTVPWAAGCQEPLTRETQQALRQSLIESHRRHLEATAAGPVIETRRSASEVEQELVRQGRVGELDEISGPGSYGDLKLDIGFDLVGVDDAPMVMITLQQAIRQAVQNNLDLQIARLRPAIAQAQVVQAEAAFDAVFFTNFDWRKLDTPQPTGTVPGLSDNIDEDSFELVTGIRKPLTSGGQVTVSTLFGRTERNPSFFLVDSFYDANVALTLEQPLLRNFGSDVSRSEIELARNALQTEREGLRDALMQTALNAEQAYWNLVFARQQLLIQLRLLERTVADYQNLLARIEFDAAPVQITEAASLVELRRSDVLRARQAVRNASDQLKRLIEDEKLPLAGEALLQPVDPPADAPLRYSLIDAVTTALRSRAELRTALLAIDDASIRQRVADNQRLPLLNLVASAQISGSQPSASDTYDQLTDVDFIDYVLGVQFEQPIGNRQAEALVRQRQLERRAAVVDYQRQARDVVLEVKDALRELITSYELIGATRAARRAAADNLRAIEAQKDAGVQLTPDFINLKLQSQERLANAEIQEAAALTDYNNAVATFYRVMGTLLERNRIDFSPTPTD